MPPKKDVTLVKTISKNIRDMRKLKYPGHGGQKKCAQKFGKTPQDWANWESGRNIPSDANQRELAAFFGITVGQLRGEIPLDKITKKAPTETAGAGVDSKVTEACAVFADFQIEVLRLQREALAGAVSADDFVGLVAAVVQASKEYAQSRSMRSRHTGA